MTRMTLSEQLRLANEDAFKAQQEVRILEDKLRDGQRQIDQLENAHKNHITSLNAEWEKKFSSEKSSKDYYMGRAKEAENELEQIHIILDAVDGAPSREVEEGKGYGSTKRAVGTRVAGAFLAIASRSSVRQPS
jgi:predicted phage tail protein